jgi:hypothetical protein
MGSAASLQTPELTSVLLTETKRSDRQIDLTDMANEDNSIFLIVYYNKTELLNDLKSCFDGVMTIPSYFNVKGRTWIPIDCNDTDEAITQFNVFVKTWDHLMERIIAVGYYDRGNRGCCFRDWIDGYHDFLVEVEIHEVNHFGYTVPGRFSHRIPRLSPFIGGIMSCFLSLDEFFS